MYAGEGFEHLDVLGYPAEQLNNSYKEKSVVLCVWIKSYMESLITLVVEYYCNIQLPVYILQ